MATIILKEGIPLIDKEGFTLPTSKIESGSWWPSPIMQGIETMIGNKKVIVPFVNILAIIE